jgi:hypothetical protein
MAMALEFIDAATLFKSIKEVRKRGCRTQRGDEFIARTKSPPKAVHKAVLEPAKPTSIPPVKKAQPELPPFIRKYPKHSEIIQHVCKFFDISTVDILSDRRTQDLVLPRHIAVYLMKELTLSSLPVIGKRLGRRDHTTILHALRKIRDRIASDESFAATVGLLRQQIMARLEKRNAAILPPEDTSVIVQ